MITSPWPPVLNAAPLHHHLGGAIQKVQPGAPPEMRARRDILMPRGKNCRETILPLNCRAITLTTGAILKEEKNVLYCGGEAIWEAF